ncbi:hypothetical protein Bbelb_372840 [Branchiostoma belcheri]|nr:hypothetical protein Bbelb_372840 [Branchiostoma belcheri]
MSKVTLFGQNPSSTALTDEFPHLGTADSGEGLSRGRATTGPNTRVTSPPTYRHKRRSQLAVRASACCLRAKTWANVRHPCVVTYERATYGLRESNFTILTCNCCTDSARSTSVPRTVLASSVLTPHFPVDLLNDHAEHTCTILVYKDDLTGDCQLVSKMPRKAQKKSTRQDPKKRAAEDTRAASDDEVNRRCTHLQRASTACTRQRGNRTEIVRCKHVQLTYHLRNVRCTQPLTVRRVVQTTYVHLASDVLPRPATLRECGGFVTQQSSGFIDSPNYPGQYGNNMYCVWTIEVDSGDVVKLTPVSFRIEAVYDWLHVYDNETLLGQYSGQFFPPEVVSTSSILHLVLITDESFTEEGFRIHFEVLTLNMSSSECPDPGVPENGYRDGENFTAGSVVTFGCHDGFILTGQERIMCMTGYRRDWTASPPTCEAKGQRSEVDIAPTPVERWLK